MSIRRVDDDCTLTYTIYRESWYAESFAGEPDKIGVHATSDGGGVKWEFAVSEHAFDGSCTKLEMFEDAYAALADVPEFFEALHADHPKTLVEVQVILDRIGAQDRTERVSPWKALRP